MATAIITSHSIDGTFESCPRRFEFLHSWMRAPDRDMSGFAADVGTAVHEAMQEWQRKRTFHQVSEKEAREAGEFMLLQYWPWLLEEERRSSQSTDYVSQSKRTLGEALLLFNQAVEQPFWDHLELLEIAGFGPAIEVPWRIVHSSLGMTKNGWGEDAYFVTQGKIDFIFRDRRTGKITVWDIKTTEKSKPVHHAAFKFSGQAGQYGFVLNHVLGLDWQKEGIDVTYLMMGFADAESIVYPLSYHLSPEEVQDSIDVKLERLSRMKFYADQKHWPRRAHGCEFYNVPCGFLDICERRDEEYIKEWFEFELQSGRFSEYKRIYKPVWTMEA